MFVAAQANVYDLKVIKNLYWEQSVKIEIENQTSDEIEIKKVYDSDGYYPQCYYADTIFGESLCEGAHRGKVNGLYTNNIRYVDDTVLIADSASDLQDIINAVDINRCEKYGLKLNVVKTKSVSVSRDNQIAPNLVRNNKKKEQ